MKKLFLRNISFFFLFCCCVVRVQAQNVQVEAKLQQYTIRIGDQTKFFLTVHQPVGQRVNFPKITDSIAGKVVIVSTGKLDTVFDQNDRKFATVTQSYVITGFDAGTYTIPPQSFGSAAGALKSNEVTLQVQTVKVDTTKAIYDIKQPLKVTYTFLDWVQDNWYWIVIPLLLIFGGIALYYYLTKRPKKEVEVKVVAPVIPAHVTAIRKLEELKNKKLWQQSETKQYYVELSDILREYLENRYSVKTHEKTTEEIFVSLSAKQINTDDKKLLKQILVLADLVKFAKEKPLPAENEQSLESAVIFVSKTQQPSVNPEGGNAHV